MASGHVGWRPASSVAAFPFLRGSDPARLGWPAAGGITAGGAALDQQTHHYVPLYWFTTSSGACCSARPRLAQRRGACSEKGFWELAGRSRALAAGLQPCASLVGQHRFPAYWYWLEARSTPGR